MFFKKIQRDDEFSEKYKEIIASLGFSHKDDIKSRDKLRDLLKKHKRYSFDHQLSSLGSLINHYQYFLVVAGGPDAEKFVQMISEITISPHFNRDNLFIIAVDGATELLAQYCIIPHLIITDLDGLQEKTALNSQYDNTYFVIHAHGDNQEKISEFEFVISTKKVIGTTQTTSKIPVINTGGFTDGDRALYFLEHFLNPTTTLFLIGYDFGSSIGKFSKPELTDNTLASSLKIKKLHYGAQLTRDFCRRTNSTIVFLEYEYEFTLKSELEDIDNCRFSRIEKETGIWGNIPKNLLSRQRKS